MVSWLNGGSTCQVKGETFVKFFPGSESHLSRSAEGAVITSIRQEKHKIFAAWILVFVSLREVFVGVAAKVQLQVCITFAHTLKWILKQITEGGTQNDREGKYLAW